MTLRLIQPAHPALQYTLEAHASAATLYMSGAVAPDDAVRAFRHCFCLPGPIRHLLVDLRRASALGPAAVETIAILLERWRSGRGGTARVIALAGHRRADSRRLAPPLTMSHRAQPGFVTAL